MLTGGNLCAFLPFYSLNGRIFSMICDLAWSEIWFAVVLAHTANRRAAQMLY